MEQEHFWVAPGLAPGRRPGSAGSVRILDESTEFASGNDELEVAAAAAAVVAVAVAAAAVSDDRGDVGN